MKNVLYLTIINIIFIFNFAKSQEAIFPLVDMKCGISLLDLKFENINIDTLQLDKHINQLQEDNYALSFINCKGSKLFTDNIKVKHFYSIKIQSHDERSIINLIKELGKFESIGHLEINSMNLNLFNLDDINLPNINGIHFIDCKEISSNLNFINQFKDIVLAKSYFNFNTNLLNNKREKDRSILLYIEQLDDLMNMNYFSDLDYLSIIIDKSYKPKLNHKILNNKFYQHKVKAKRFCIDNKYKDIDSVSLNFVLNLVSSENIEVDNIDVKDLDLELLTDYKVILFHQCNIGYNLDRFLKLKNLEEIDIYYSKIGNINVKSIKESKIRVELGSKNEIAEENKELFEKIKDDLRLHNSKINEEKYNKSQK